MKEATEEGGTARKKSDNQKQEPWRIYQYEISPFCEKIRMLLNYKGIKFEVVNIPVTANIRKVTGSPIGQVPVVDISPKKKLADSVHIARYVEKHFPTPPVYPSDPKMQAFGHILETWAGDTLLYYQLRARISKDEIDSFKAEALANEGSMIKAVGSMNIVFKGRFDNRINSHGIGRKPQEMFEEEIDNTLTDLSALIKDQKYLLGDELMLTDISVWVMISSLGKTALGKEKIGKFPLVSEWMDRVQDSCSPD
eukprot:TRINITY_DN2077_c0_g2_i1.p1 TRINITY_DN2077_c0_g2~~TRINITY_DN2077_c0_g2_i1.p1  ORF type:complete len:253 (-),score=40.48 TRINITY_DN2077_c0_g2_i1:96-854(-)